MNKDDRLFAPLRRLRRIKQAIQRQFTGDEGQGLVEYGLILLLVAIVCVTALGALAQGVIGGINAAANMFP